MSITVTMILAFLLGKSFADDRPDYGIPIGLALFIHVVVTVIL